MLPTVVFISYPRLTQYIKELGISLPQEVNFRIIDLTLDVEAVLDMEREGTVDVFISSGGNAKLLSQHLTTTLVEVEVTGFDLLQAFLKVKVHANRAAIVSCLESLPPIDPIREILALEVESISYEQPQEVDPILNRLREQGIYDIVGGSLIAERAEAMGLRGHIIYSEEGISHALSTASRLALAQREHVERAQVMQAVFDFAHSGILAVDSNGLITNLNKNAAEIAGRQKKDMLGQPAHYFFHKSKLQTVLTTGQPATDQVEQIGKQDVLTNWVPLLIKGRLNGAVATFQPIGAVQASEQKIRLNLYQKGLVAKNTLDNVVGTSRTILQAKSQARLFAKSESTVLIIGETGTGKEIFAQGIHNASRRAQGPFVAINCAALPENLLESELFGYEGGAFTGARKQGKPELFELAHRGTIFLDEIGEIALGVQARLLRVLEEREVMRIGGDRVIPVDVRIIAATNKNLHELAQESFRKDLFYRLCVLLLRLPPLRERPEDVPIFLECFLREQDCILPRPVLTAIMEHQQFRTYQWPGNVRQLRNFAERLATLAFMTQDPNELVSLALTTYTSTAEEESRKDEVLRALKAAGGNRKEAAELLGISRTTLWRRMREWGLDYDETMKQNETAN